MVTCVLLRSRRLLVYALLVLEGSKLKQSSFLINKNYICVCVCVYVYV